MTIPAAPPPAPPSPLAGIVVEAPGALAAVQELLRAHRLLDCTVLQAAPGGSALRIALRGEAAAAWTPAHDTLRLAEALGAASCDDSAGLARETLAAMLAAPVAFRFPSVDELVSALRIRCHIAQAAARTTLAFDTDAAERPVEDWVYDEAHGFRLRPGRDLVEALVRATQPAVSGQLYSFSCYRATEYVILLGIALELRASHPALLERLTRQWQQRAIRSARFHDVFLHEYGSMEAPLPPRYYVPGDRLWFRNPDERSADITGFEGSWVFYLGGGLFSNFWQRGRPFTLASKALEIHHWRDGAVPGPGGALVMDETIVATRVAATLEDPAQMQRILARMLRMRDPKGVYAEGGCIDATREYPRCVRPGTADIRLPPLPPPTSASGP